MRVWLWMSVFAVSVAGCATAPTLNRWSTAAGVPAVTPPILYVSSAASPPSSSDSVTFRNLPERTGAAFVKAIADKNKDSKDFAAAIQQPFKDKDDSGPIDTTKVPRVLLLSVQREWVRPGDRLLATTVDIQPIGFRFSDYSLAATEHSVVNIGTVAVTNLRGENIGVAPAAAATVAAGFSGGLSASQSDSSTRSVATNTELSVHVAPDLIEVYRTGADGQDLTGNTLIKLSLRLLSDKTKEFTLANPHLLDDDGKVQKPANVKLDITTISLNPARDLYVCARLAYEDRLVDKGAGSYDEGRQDVTLKTGETIWKKYLIAPLEELETPLWEIRVGASGLLFDDGIRIEPLSFDDYDAAKSFMSYLRRFQTGQLANGKLVQGTKVIPQAIGSFAALSLVRVSQTRADPTEVNCPAQLAKSH